MVLVLTFDQYRPVLQTIEHSASSVRIALANATCAADEIACFEQWEQQRRHFATWKAAVGLRFRQNTADGASRLASEELASLAPVAERNDADVKMRFLTSRYRPQLEELLGSYVFERWQNDISNDHFEIADDLTREMRLVDAYNALLAGASIDFAGKRQSLASLAVYAEAVDRSTREEAIRAGWELLDENRAQLDNLFDQLVNCRDAIAKKVGTPTFAEVAYRRLGRTDYEAADVGAFRSEVLTHIVPLVAELVRSQAHDIGVAELMPWDEQVFDLGGPIDTPSTVPQVVERVQLAFSAAAPELGEFASLLVREQLLDLDCRANKSSGAFCSYFPSLGVPFVFANVNGASRDVLSVVHEMGHAFQDFKARDKRVLEYMIPTSEAGEIHAMALEYLLFLHYDALFGDDAPRYRSRHLRTMLGMLPYIAAIDEFQELVYQNPRASADERAQMWLALEKQYLPWRDATISRHLSSGRAWHRQRHIFGSPFYYIDYGLALCCALQIWQHSIDNYETAIRSYVDLCGIGGELPFRKLVAVAGLRSPFEPDALRQVACQARSYLRSDAKARPSLDAEHNIL